MVNYLLKKSYQLKDLQEIDFKDLWGDHGVFTTMWIYDKPSKILFFKDHINNLIKSTKAYSIYKPFLKKNILKLLKENLNSKTKYNHLLRIALNKKTLSISLRKRIKPKLNFDLKLVKLKRQKPEFKNLKYLEIFKHLTKLDNSKADIGLCSNNKIFKSKIKNLINKDINVNSLKEFDEIILIGSGKGVASVKTINQIKWKRKSLKFYNIFSRHYKSAINNCKRYS